MQRIEIEWDSNDTISNITFTNMDVIYCRHCGEEVELESAGEHLHHCRPDVAKAIEAEFSAKENAALSIAAH